MNQIKINMNDFLALVIENPELDVIAMVEGSEIVDGENHNRWLGSIGESSVECVCHLDDRIYFRDDDEDEIIEDYIENNYEDYLGIYMDDFNSQQRAKNLPKLKKDAEKYCDGLPWKKVIVLNIDLP